MAYSALTAHVGGVHGAVPGPVNTVVSAGRKVTDSLNPPTSDKMFCSALIAAP
ncbi:Uncharacterised protein [Mycobacteroides abscessus subsp. bolletii]|nr:Uncharacterised protein [Mycobacteroides abscessus subsp. bolletii]